MSFDKHQFEDLIRRTLTEVDPDLAADNAVRLLMGTCAQESKMGHYLRQLGQGPAIGVMQMEPKTFQWLQETHQNRVTPINWTCIKGRKAEEMEWDLKLSIIMARLRYYVVAAPIPDVDDLLRLANYYKKYYNSSLGAADTADFIANYQTYC